MTRERPRCSRLRTGSKQLGMSEYAERFVESDVDTSVLDQDLKELGVSLGHRRKILRAIAELSGSREPALQAVLDGA